MFHKRETLDGIIYVGDNFNNWVVSPRDFLLFFFFSSLHSFSLFAFPWLPGLWLYYSRSVKIWSVLLTVHSQRVWHDAGQIVQKHRNCTDGRTDGQTATRTCLAGLNPKLHFLSLPYMAMWVSLERSHQTRRLVVRPTILWYNGTIIIQLPRDEPGPLYKINSGERKTR